MVDFLIEFLNKTYMIQKKLHNNIDSQYDELVLMIEHSLHCIEYFLQINSDEDKSIFVLYELISRAHKTTHALMLLCYSDFELQSLSLIRDLIETHYFIVYFMKKPEEMKNWLNSEYKERQNKYSPSTLRKIISGDNSTLKESLDHDYSGHSTFTHIIPELLKIQKGHTDNKNENIDRRFVRLCLTEIAYHIIPIAHESSNLGLVITKDDIFNKKILKLKELSKTMPFYQMIGSFPLSEYLEKGNSLSKNE